jgi:amino-acid N-acetyltransferase
MTFDCEIGKAVVSDVSGIHGLISLHSKKNVLLPRSCNEIYSSLFNFFVARVRGCVIGCVSVVPTWSGKGSDVLCEIRSLVVDPKWQRDGVGIHFVNLAINEAVRIGAVRVFALTYIPEFFFRAGFYAVSRDSLPRKVWTECINCPEFEACKEVPVVKDLRQDE